MQSSPYGLLGWIFKCALLTCTLTCNPINAATNSIHVRGQLTHAIAIPCAAIGAATVTSHAQDVASPSASQYFDDSDPSDRDFLEQVVNNSKRYVALFADAADGLTPNQEEASDMDIYDWLNASVR